MGDDKPAKRVNNEGSVYHRKSDDRWCAALSLPSTGGKPRRVVRVVPRKGTERQQKAAAEAKLTELRRELAKSGDIPTTGQTLESWLRVWFNTIAVKQNRPTTQKTWRSVIENHIIPSIGRVQLAKLTPAHVRKMEDDIAAKGLQPTAVLAYSILSRALEYALREGRVTSKVTDRADAPRKARPNLAVLTPLDGLKVLQAVTGDPENGVAPDRLASRWWAALLTGARQGEVLGIELDRVGDDLDLSWQLQRLSWEHGCGDPTGADDEGKRKWPCGKKRGTDCPDRKLTAPADWEHRHLTGGLYLSRPKSDAGKRPIPLVDPLRAIIEKRIETIAADNEPNPHGLLWTADPKKDKRGRTLPLDGSPIDPRNDLAAWHAVLERAGALKVPLHGARHTAASLLLEANVPEPIIMKILGHSSYAVSMGYMNVDRRQLAEAMSSMSARMIEAKSPQ